MKIAVITTAEKAGVREVKNGAVWNDFWGMGNLYGDCLVFGGNHNDVMPLEEYKRLEEADLTIIEHDRYHDDFDTINAIRSHSNVLMVWLGQPLNKLCMWEPKYIVGLRKLLRVVDLAGVMNADHIEWYQSLSDEAEKVFHFPTPVVTSDWKRFAKTEKENLILANVRADWYDTLEYKRNTLTTLLFFKEFKKLHSEFEGVTFLMHQGKEDDMKKILKNLNMDIEVLGFQPKNKWLERLSKCKMAFYLSSFLVEGKLDWDCSCVRTPLIENREIETHRRLFPKTGVGAYNLKESLSMAEKLLKDENFYKEVTDYAYENVEYYNVENCKKRLENAIKEVKEK